MHLDALNSSLLACSDHLTLILPSSRNCGTIVILILLGHVFAPRRTVHSLKLFLTLSVWFRRWWPLFTSCYSSCTARSNHEVAIILYLNSTMRCASLLTSLHLKLNSRLWIVNLWVLLSIHLNWRWVTAFSIRLAYEQDWIRRPPWTIGIDISVLFINTFPDRHLPLIFICTLLRVHLLTNHC